MKTLGFITILWVALTGMALADTCSVANGKITIDCRSSGTGVTVNPIAECAGNKLVQYGCKESGYTGKTWGCTNAQGQTNWMGFNKWTDCPHGCANGACKPAPVTTQRCNVNSNKILIVGFPFATPEACLADANYKKESICLNIARNPNQFPCPPKEYAYDITFAGKVIGRGTCPTVAKCPVVTQTCEVKSNGVQIVGGKSDSAEACLANPNYKKEMICANIARNPKQFPCPPKEYAYTISFGANVIGKGVCPTTATCPASGPTSCNGAGSMPKCAGYVPDQSGVMVAGTCRPLYIIGSEQYATGADCLKNVNFQKANLCTNIGRNIGSGPSQYKPGTNKWVVTFNKAIIASGSCP